MSNEKPHKPSNTDISDSAKSPESTDNKTKEKKEDPQEELVCGLVMPISEIDGCNEQHWSDVKGILTDAVKSVGFKANIVSDADEIGIIQKRIIQNLYENPIVVCDVSGKNPNVMFELGLRLAFDKPTIIVKDDKTSYSFDTSPIEHLEYPRDLRYSKIVDFKKALGLKVKATLEKAKNDESYTTFLKHFGTFKIAKLDSTELSKEDYIIEELKELRKSINGQNYINPTGELSKKRLLELLDLDNGGTIVKEYPSDFNLSVDVSKILKSGLIPNKPGSLISETEYKRISNRVASFILSDEELFIKYVKIKDLDKKIGEIVRAEYFLKDTPQNK